MLLSPQKLEEGGKARICGRFPKERTQEKPCLSRLSHPQLDGARPEQLWSARAEADLKGPAFVQREGPSPEGEDSPGRVVVRTRARSACLAVGAFPRVALAEKELAQK